MGLPTLNVDSGVEGDDVEADTSLGGDALLGIKLSRVDVGEKCPACRGSVLFGGSLGGADCVKGHQWGEPLLTRCQTIIIANLHGSDTERCSATFALMSSPFERTCTGCNRHTLPPRSENLETSSSDQNSSNDGDWVTDDVLSSGCYCVYCGSRFVRMI